MPAFLRTVSDLLITNPICIRLIQGGSTRQRHLYVRSGYLAVLIIVLLMSLLGAPGGGTLRELARAGAGAFGIVAVGQVALICLLTPIFMAGAIAQEANPRTWDILLTTPLNALQIVLGNLFGRLFFILALLLSSLPLFLFVQAFGGVPGRSIVLSYLVAAVSSLVVAAIAVTLSVTRTAGRRAVFAFYVSVIVYLAITWLIDAQLRTGITVGGMTTATTVMTPLNPFLALESLLQGNRYVAVDPGLEASSIVRWWLGSPISAFVWTGITVSGVLVVFSTARLRVIGGKVGQLPWYRRWFGLGARSGEGRVARSPGTNPIAWRETSSRSLGAVGMLGRWGFVSTTVIVTIALLWIFHVGNLSLPALRQSFLALVVAEVAIVVLAAINMSATAVSREREDGTLDIILTTPIQPGPYLAGKLRGLVQYLLPMLLVPVLTTSIAFVYALARPEATTDQVQNVLLGSGTLSVPLVSWSGPVALAVLMPAFTAFVVMVGLQWSIRSKGTIGSIVSAVMVLLVVVGVLGLCGAAGGRINVLAELISATSPFNLVFATLRPEATLPTQSIETGTDRGILAIGAVLAAIVYGLIVYGMHATMKQNFMMTVRRLAGTR
jgi:ABC-type transport system involved in multi-copper enzyme maturation permease subunit